MLDYIVTARDPKYLQPSSATLEIVPLKSAIHYDLTWCTTGVNCLVSEGPKVIVPTGGIPADLSDHYPVVANFVFPTLDTPVPRLNGCQRDSDCHFEPSLKASCYCTGPGCSWAGKPASGWKLGGHHPINANCHFRAGATESCFCRPGDE